MERDILFYLSAEVKFEGFLNDDFARQSQTVTCRGLVADPDSVPHPQRMTARQKAAAIQLMLGSADAWEQLEEETDSKIIVKE